MRRGRTRWWTMLVRRGRVAIRTAVVLLVAAIAAVAELRAAGEQQKNAATPHISPRALAQIDALIKEKESRSASEQKIDSQLIFERKMKARKAIAPGVDRLEVDIPYANDGHAIVDVSARASSDITGALTALGLEIVSVSRDHTRFRVHVPIDRIETIAALPDVIFVKPRQNPRIFRSIQTDAAATIPGQGSRRSEGDIAHLAAVARAEFGTTGKDVRIGVLSDGVTNLRASQASGDLGEVTVLEGQAGSGTEGTAMLEIIHDIAPDASLFFATGITGVAQFAQNIRDLRNAGCDIIVDDVLYGEESPFNDGQPPTVAINEVTASGALYFSSAGNNGNLDAGTSGTWEGDFADGGANGFTYRVHSFDAGVVVNVLTAATTNPINLYWSDPPGHSDNDYDLFRLNETGTAVLASSLTIQNGYQDPAEHMSGTNAAPGQLIVIAKKNAAQARFLHLDANGGRLSIATAGQLRGHPQAPGAFAVGAAAVGTPFPAPFTGSHAVEDFSSDGPRRVFFDVNNAAYTPGDLLSTGGQLRQKPDLTAADGVQVTDNVGPGSPFFGSSAAAPHAAAIAALLKSALPTATPDQLRTALLSTAIDIESAEVDRDSGAGIIMATEALRALDVPRTPRAVIEVAGVEVADNPGNGNGTPEAGEGARLSVSLANYGTASATAVTASLTTSTPGITIEQESSRDYGDIAPSSTSAARFIVFTVASDFPCPGSARFTLKVNYGGGPSPTRDFVLDVPIGLSSYRVSKKMDGHAAFSSPGVATSTDVQTVRLTRTGTASICGIQKPTPTREANPTLTLLPTTNRRFDAYAFNTCTQSVPSCVRVELQGTNATGLFAVAYSPAFNPLSIQENYKADAGTSLFFRAFSFDHPGGGQTFAVDVHDVSPSLLPSRTAYTLTVTGACMGGCDPPNHVPVAKVKDVTVAARPDVCGSAASIDDGSFDEDGDPLEITQSPSGPYHIGSTPVLLTVKDPKGAISQASAIVTVVDATPPQLTCPAPISVSAPPGACGALVSFSTDATDTCSPPVTVVSTQAPGSIFPVGTTTVATTATDAAGNTATCALPITVVDNEPPVINNLVLTQTSRSFSNRTLVDVSVDYGQSDNCRAATCVVSVTGGDTRTAILSNLRSNGQESDSEASGSNVPNFIIIDAHHVQLSVDRSGRGNSRTYTITVTCTDAAGNQTIKSATITVQRD
jgi:hypothetical protein